MKMNITTKVFRCMKMASLLFLVLFSTSAKVRAAVWTTGTAGDIATLTNWTNGSSSPTSFFTPGDSWTITLPMTMNAFSSWTVGTVSTAPASLTFAPGGSITSSFGGASPVITLYGNLIGNGGTYTVNGGAAVPVINVYGTTMISTSTFTVNGGGAVLTYNSHGSFRMTGGSISVFGGGADLRMNMYGDCHLSGPSALVSSGGGAFGSLHFCLPAASGTMMIDNYSTGAWSAIDVFVDTACKAQLDSNFTTTTGTSANGLTVYGTLIVPAADTVVGTHNFNVTNTGTLIVGHPTGINGAIATTGTVTLDVHASYGFNGTAPQVTGTLLPTALLDPDTIIIDNNFGVTLSQNTASTGVLSFLHGILFTGSYAVALTGATNSVIGAGAGKYVCGNLEKTISGYTSVNYEVGDSSYVPMLLTLSAAGTAGSFTVRANFGPHPSMGTSGIATTNKVNHYWSVANNSAAGPASVIVKGTYQTSDITGGSNAYFVTQQYYASAWAGVPFATTNTVSPYTSALNTGILLANISGDFIFGRRSSTLEEQHLNHELTMAVSPNPNAGTFVVELAGQANEPATIIVTNVLGATIKILNTATNTATPLTLHVPAGMYMVTAATGSGSQTARIVVQ